jgi:hypothetical protein
MAKRVWYRTIFAVPALLAFLAAAWVLGNLLLDVQLAGQDEDRIEMPLPAPEGATLRDVFGFSFLGHLLHKAREGVRIRILLDALGTRMSLDVTGNDYLDTLVGIENVTLKMYRPLYFRFTDVFLTLNPIALAASDHDKILIVNGRIARDRQGRPERDGDGKVVVAFGTKSHATPEQWKDVKRYWTLLRIAKKLPGTSRLLWK